MPSSIRKALDELPTSLDDTYERTLQGIPKEKRHHAHRLFQCLVAAIRPLRAEELADIFAIDFGQSTTCNFREGWRPENPEEAVLSTCSTLITVIEDEGSRRVQFSHFSVKEFLTSDRVRTSEVGSIRDYYILLDDAHTILARACLAILLQLDERVDVKRVETLPLVSYAAEHWVEHAKYEDVGLRVQGSMEEFFNPTKPHVAAWVLIHDVAQALSMGYYFGNLKQSQCPPSTAALFYAALCGFSEVANYLITTHTGDVNASYRQWGSPLHVASGFGHAGVVSLLLQHGAEVNARCTSSVGQTPLHFVSWTGHAKVIQLLLKHGADINAQCITDSTPLTYASESGRLEIVRLLLQNGADVHLRGFEGKTSFQIATDKGHVEVARLLIENGAEKNRRVWEGI